MVERNLANLSPKELSREIRGVLQTRVKKSYLASKEDRQWAREEVFEKYTTAAERDAQALRDKISGMIVAINQRYLKTPGGSPLILANQWTEESLKDRLDHESERVVKRSEAAFIGSYTRRHKDEADPKTAAYQKLGEIRTEAQEKLKQKNEHLAEIIEIYEEVAPIVPVAKKDSWLKKHTPQAVRATVAVGITALAIHAAASLKPEALVYADQPNKTPIPAPTDIVDTQPSNHPSGKDRNVEPGNSGTQGESESNPDGNGVDKPYPADEQSARSQGRDDNDGNNGCGNDNDFSDDNNGNCGGKKKETPIPTPTPPLPTPTPPTSPTPQESPTPKATSTPTPLPGATPTAQPVGTIPPAVTPEVEKPAQPTPPTVPMEKQPPAAFPPTLPKAGDIPLPLPWLAGFAASLMAAGLSLKKRGLRR